MIKEALESLGNRDPARKSEMGLAKRMLRLENRFLARKLEINLAGC
jgi:hypothetical protein